MKKRKQPAKVGTNKTKQPAPVTAPVTDVPQPAKPEKAPLPAPAEQFSSLKRGGMFFKKVKQIQQEIDKELTSKKVQSLQELAEKRRSQRQTRQVQRSLQQTKLLLQNIKKKYKVNNKPEDAPPLQARPSVIPRVPKRPKLLGVIQSHDLLKIEADEIKIDFEQLLQQDTLFFGEKYQYLHAERLIDDFSEFKFFGTGRAFSSQVYDTWAANAMLLVRNSKRLFSYFLTTEFTDKNLFAFRFYESTTRPVTVVTNSMLPVVKASTTSVERPIFSHIDPAANETWLQLALKAYALFLGSKANLGTVSLSEAIFNLTGRLAEVFQFNETQRLQPDVFDYFTLLVEAGSLVAFYCSVPNKKTPLPKEENRLYVLRETGKEVINLSCQWAEGDPRLLVNYGQLHKMFNRAVVLSDQRPGQSHQAVCLPIYSTGLPSSNSSELFTKGSQLVFAVKEEALDLKIVQVSLNKVEMSYGFYLFQLGEKQNRIACLNTSKLKAFVRSQPRQQRLCYKSVKLQRGRYSLIPFSSILSEDCFLSFEFSFLSKSELKAALLFERYRGREVFFNGSGKLENRESLEEVRRVVVKYPEASVFMKQHRLKQSKWGECLYSLCARQMIALEEEEPTPALAVIEPKRVADGSDLRTEMLLEQLLAGSAEGVEPSGVFDFSYMKLGKSFGKLVQTLARQPEVTEIGLADCELDDQLVVLLCQQLQENSHYECRLIDLRGNKVGVAGERALRYLKERLTKVEVRLGQL